RVGARHGLALAILVPPAMGDGDRIERPRCARLGTNDGAASAERGCVRSLRLRGRGIAALAGLAHAGARHRSFGRALAGNLRRTDGRDLVAAVARTALD